MTPAYRGLRSSGIPVVRTDDEIVVKVVAGEFAKVEGPIRGIPVDPSYLDVAVPAGRDFVHPTKPGYTAFAFTVHGEGRFDPNSAQTVGPNAAILFGDGPFVRIHAEEPGLRFLLVSGKPLREPVAWYGPILMNRREEILQAAVELERGNFIKTKEETQD